jgi:hypothetical protein
MPWAAAVRGAASEGALKHKPIIPPAGEAGCTELVWLLGQPHLSDYLQFVATKVPGGREIDARALTAEWRAANDLYYEIERTEAGIADTIECLKLAPKLRPLARAVEANPWFKSSFDNLPVAVERVELDKLVVSQNHIESTFTGFLGGTLGAAPDEAALFRFCLPLERPAPPVRIQRLSGDRYLFSSPSTDFRAHHPMLLRPDQLGGVTSVGPYAAMVGIMVGFGSNFMSAIRSGSRVLLQNGYHRAFTLRSLGFTHAYCIVEEVTRKDELKLTAEGDVAADPEYYFAAKRPPLLRDFFDPRLARPLMALPMENHVEVELQVRSSTATQW